MQLSKELGKFSPSWLVESKCRQIANHYYESSPKNIRDDLSQTKRSLSRKSDLIDFLENDGESLWNRFVSDLTATDDARDFKPFTKDESEALRDRIDLAFGTNLDDAPPRFNGDGPNDQKNTEHRKASGLRMTRLIVALTLLVGGFGVIFSTYLYLPEITRKFQQQSTEGINQDVNDNLQAVLEQLRGPAFANLSSQITQLQNNFLGVESSLDQFRQFSGQLVLAQSASNEASQRLVDQLSESDAVSQQVNSIIQSFQAPVDSADPNAAQGLEAALRNVADQTSAMVTQVEVLSKVDAVKLGLEQYESQAAGLIIDFTSAWDRTSRSTGTSIISAAENAAINAMRDWDPEGELTLPVQDMLELIEAIRTESKAILVPDGFVNQIEGLSGQLSELTKAGSALTTQVVELKGQSEALNAALESQVQNEALNRLSTQSAELFQTVSLASSVIRQSQQTYENTANVLEDLEDGASSLKGLAELQSDLLFRGASPAVLLLLAIGGMFVTFGLTSLLKWVKDGDQTHSELAWHKQARLYAVLASALMERGIDPAPFLSRLQAISVGVDGEQHAIKTPASETIAEIAKALKGALGRG